MLKYFIALGLLMSTFGLSNAADLSSFGAMGQSSINLTAPISVCTNVGLTCFTGDVCQCVEATGTLEHKSGKNFAGTFDLVLNVDNTYPARQYPNGASAQSGLCFMTSGVLNITPKKGSGVSLVTSGLSCNGKQIPFTNTDQLETETYQGAFVVVPIGGDTSPYGTGTIEHSFIAYTNTLVGTLDVDGVYGE